MPAAYDTYDYPSYWLGREYEHQAEVIALKAFLEKVPKIHKILDLGAGYGRLTPIYLHRAKKVILSDPSAKLLGIARDEYGRQPDRKIEFIHSCLENLPKKLKPGSVDVILCIRVLHHIQDIDRALKIINRLVCRGGFLILEFANKRHFKATLAEFVKGNLTYPLDIFPKDIRSLINIRRKTLPFLNFHPDDVCKKLEDCNFEILETRSLSNIRSSFLKKILPLDSLLTIESSLQTLFGRLHFGPSVFVLARKRDTIK